MDANDILRLDHEAEMEYKAKQVQIALKGMAVTYKSHDASDLTPDMARVENEHGLWSIIWHGWSYGYGKREVVEVMPPSRQEPRQVLIKDLRALIERGEV